MEDNITQTDGTQTAENPFYSPRRRVVKKVADRLGVQIRFMYWLEGAGVIRLAHNPDPDGFVKCYIMPEDERAARAWIDEHGIPEHYRAIKEDKPKKAGRPCRKY